MISREQPQDQISHGQPFMTEPPAQRVLFVQPFSVGGNGGGSRILTSMIKGQPFDKLSINSNRKSGPALDWIEERHLPIRPALGRLDRSRFATIGDWLEIFTRPGFEKKLAREMEKWRPNVVHVIPHWSCDFHLAWRLARARGCRVVMSVHDDLSYSLRDYHPFRDEALRLLGEMWRDADHAFVISQEMGEEYNTRYGKRSFEIITDGLEEIPAHPTPMTEGRLQVYFMGLFHYNYRENLRALARALARLKNDRPEMEIGLILRCGDLGRDLDLDFPVRVLPFAGQETILDDMTRADLLYLPLPFGEQYEALTRHSLSTKMVSYLGSGVPILLHGPSESAASRFLLGHRAALACPSLDENVMAQALKIIDDPKTKMDIAENALTLARTSFPLEELRRKFANGLLTKNQR
jgi:glycosyltransferase involved in cell wall biosynthesis